jgi:hypothetical protein
MLKEKTMRSAVALLLVAALAACAKKEEATPDSAAAAAAPAAPTVASFAGTWASAAVLEGSPDTVKSTLTIGADGSCSLMLPDRPTVTCTTSMSGDSLVVQTSEYESVMRKGVMTSVRSASVMSGSTMTGSLVSTYKMPSGEQKVNGTITSTKAP